MFPNQLFEAVARDARRLPIFEYDILESDRPQKRLWECCEIGSKFPKIILLQIILLGEDDDRKQNIRSAYFRNQNRGTRSFCRYAKPQTAQTDYMELLIVNAWICYWKFGRHLGWAIGIWLVRAKMQYEVLVELWICPIRKSW